MITYKAGAVLTAEEAQDEFGITSCFPCATIDVAGDSRTGPHESAIMCWGIDREEAIERRGLILAAMKALSMVEVVQ